MSKLFWIGFGMMWIAVALAVSVGIYFTHNIHCLWFLLIPACIRIKAINDKEEE